MDHTSTGYFVSAAFLWAAALLNLAVTLVLAKRVKGLSKMHGAMKMPDVGLAPNDKAPAFTSETLEGEVVTSDDLRGRPFTFFFFKTDCVPCMEKFPIVDALNPEAASMGVRLLLVSKEPDPELGQEMEKYSVQSTVLQDQSGTHPIAKDFKAHFTPSYCTVGADGKVQGAGLLVEADWKEELIQSWREVSEGPGK